VLNVNFLSRMTALGTGARSQKVSGTRKKRRRPQNPEKMAMILEHLH
jgi:hypothetical protein